MPRLVCMPMTQVCIITLKSVSEIRDNLIPAFLKICDWLRSNKRSLNTVNTEFMVIGSLSKLNNMDSVPVTTPYLISIDSFTILFQWTALLRKSST